MSEPGQNLLFSILLRPDFLEARFVFRLSATVAVGIARALETRIPGLKLKWPNDLYAGEKKLGGMLIETVLSGLTVERAICGIGLNINQRNLSPTAISLAEIMGQEQDKEALLEEITKAILEQYRLLKSGQWPAIRSAYLARLYRLATPAWYRLPDGTRFQALIKSIGEQGELILLCQDGEKSFHFKQVAFEF
jgi:BirA family biotin operon repressor/biotin-[acetyl-CoA-carboxylase] ligase